jgi:hypothetical protein
VNPVLIVCDPLMSVTSSFTVNLGCFVPLYEAAPHVENSVNWMAPMFWLQSTAFGMQTLSFQF